MKVLYEPGRRTGGRPCAVAIVNSDGSPIENEITPASYATLPPAEQLGAFHSQLVIATNGGWPVSDFTARVCAEALLNPASLRDWPRYTAFTHDWWCDYSGATGHKARFWYSDPPGVLQWPRADPVRRHPHNSRWKSWAP